MPKESHSKKPGNDDTRDSTAQGGKPKPLTARGWRTRSKILEAARRVFERDGFLDVKVTDITKEAGVAAGSFYTYFESKEETFQALLDMMRDEILHHEVEQATPVDDPIESIRRATRTYFDSYRKNLGLWRIFEQMAAMDSTFRQARLDRAAVFSERNTKSIRKLQERGLADPSVSPELASLALSSMVSRIAQLIFNFGFPVDDIDDVVETVVDIWVKTLRIERTT